MTLDLSNPGKLALKDLPDDVAAGMFLAWRAGSVIEQGFDDLGWQTFDEPLWHSGCFFRVCPAPAKQLAVPWEMLDPWIKAVAMDGDGIINGFDAIPALMDSYWMGGSPVSLSILVFDTAGIDWRESLQIRPEGM